MAREKGMEYKAIDANVGAAVSTSGMKRC